MCMPCGHMHVCTCGLCVRACRYAHVRAYTWECACAYAHTMCMLGCEALPLFSRLERAVWSLPFTEAVGGLIPWYCCPPQRGSLNVRTCETLSSKSDAHTGSSLNKPLPTLWPGARLHKRLLNE